MVKKNKNTVVQENPTINENVGAQGNTGVQGNSGVQSNAGIKDNTGVQGNAGTQDNINTNSNIMQDNTVGSVQGNTGMQEDTINGYQTEQNGIVAGQDSQDYPVYQGSSGGQPISGVTTTSNSDLISEQDDFSKQLVSKDLLITIFLSAIGLYIIVSALIYFSSYFIKSKNDNIIEHFFEETFDNNKKKEENQFYMDPSIHKNPQVKRDFNEKDNINDYDNIWEKSSPAIKNTELKVNVDNNNYPITTPVPASPMVTSPKQRNDIGYCIPPTNYNNQRKQDYNESPGVEYGHHQSDSTSSATSMTNLIPKDHKGSNDSYNEIDEVRPRTTSENRNHPRNQRNPDVKQFSNGGVSSPHIRFSMDQGALKSYDNNKIIPPRANNPPNSKYDNSRENKSAGSRPAPSSESRNANKDRLAPDSKPHSSRPHSPNPRSPNPRSPNLHSPNPRSPNPRSPNNHYASPHSSPRSQHSNIRVPGNSNMRSPNVRNQGTPRMRSPEIGYN